MKATAIPRRVVQRYTTGASSESRKRLGDLQFRTNQVLTRLATADQAVGRAIDEHLGGARLVITGMLQRAQNQSFFRLFYRGADREPHRIQFILNGSGRDTRSRAHGHRDRDAASPMLQESRQMLAKHAQIKDQLVAPFLIEYAGKGTETATDETEGEGDADAAEAATAKAPKKSLPGPV